MHKLLFLCSGNYYRSRFAEIFFNWHAEQRGLNWRAESRGLIMLNDNLGPMSRVATARLGHHGIPADTYQRFPKKVTLEDMEAAQRIIAMKRSEHLYAIENYFSTQLDRVEFWDIHDLDSATPEEMWPHLESALLALLDQLRTEESNGDR
jgi:protein-tyrosine phosphatase